MRKFYWGWFSEQAAQTFGSTIYETEDGTREVEVTSVSREDVITYCWPDKVPIGPVGQYLREGRARRY
jgi:hypothetical protein